MSHSAGRFSRRRFLAAASAAYAGAKLLPFAPISPALAADPRVAEAPVADKGFASIRKIGDGVYATITDRTKGLQTRSNGGFIIGRDGALLVEGFQTPIGAAFQMDTYKMVSKVPVRAAIDTHFHFDHSLGNSYYGGMGVPVWAHAKAASRMTERLSAMASGEPGNVSCAVGTARACGEKRFAARTREERYRRADGNVRAGKPGGAGAAEPSARPGEDANEGGPWRAHGGDRALHRAHRHGSDFPSAGPEHRVHGRLAGGFAISDKYRRRDEAVARNAGEIRGASRRTRFSCQDTGRCAAWIKWR